jgi:murein L,D-transpeptidase YcbB/YkuD
MRTLLSTCFLFTLASAWGAFAAVDPRPSSQELLLSEALAFYKQLDATRTWSVFPVNLCLRQGDTGAHVGKLRRNLLLTGDLPEADTSAAALFDDHLTQALKRFQRRHGLKPDGIAGLVTLISLNITPDQRVQQIELNLQRWRQVPVDAFPLILVNIPDFSLKVYDYSEEIVWQTRVIVGQAAEGFQTAPILSKISYLVYNPSWNIPKSIIRKELIPILKKDPAYLSRNHMELVRQAESRQAPLSPYQINWRKADPEKDKFMIIQQPGAHNSLGRIKFIFHNTNTQYLHDTPAKTLFQHPVRAYSHGCVRVQEAEMLAAYLLQPDWETALQPSQAASFQRTNKIIYLPEPVNVKIAYFTAWVDEKGILNFRPDLYQLDGLKQEPGLSQAAEIPIHKKF